MIVRRGKNVKPFYLSQNMLTGLMQHYTTLPTTTTLPSPVSFEQPLTLSSPSDCRERKMFCCIRCKCSSPPPLSPLITCFPCRCCRRRRRRCCCCCCCYTKDMCQHLHQNTHVLRVLEDIIHIQHVFLIRFFSL